MPLSETSPHFGIWCPWFSIMAGSSINWIKSLYFWIPRLVTMICMWSCPEYGRKVSSHILTLSDYGRHLRVSHKHHNFGNIILTTTCARMNSHSPKLTLSSISAVVVIWCCCIFDSISMVYLKDATYAAINVSDRLLATCMITNCGQECQFLIIQIHREENGTFISLGQKAFIIAILIRIHMHNPHNISTPMDRHVNLDRAKERGQNELTHINGYQEIIGSVIYASLTTRPDISFSVTVLCRYNSPCFTSHLTAAKCVPSYLKFTATFWMHCSSSSSSTSNDQLTGHTDSDSANDSPELKSHTGHVFCLRNGAGSWQTRKQDLIAMTTLKAEYITFFKGSQNTKWVLQLHWDIPGKDTTPLQINYDNQREVNLIKGDSLQRAQTISMFELTILETSKPARFLTTPTCLQRRLRKIQKPRPSCRIS